MPAAAKSDWRRPSDDVFDEEPDLSRLLHPGGEVEQAEILLNRFRAAHMGCAQVKNLYDY